MEGYARLKTEADRLSALSEQLERKAEAFEEVDAQAQAGLNDVGRTLLSWQDAGLNFLAGAGLSWAEVRGDLAGKGPRMSRRLRGYSGCLGFSGRWGVHCSYREPTALPHRP
jgi:hypothetical protein